MQVYYGVWLKDGKLWKRPQEGGLHFETRLQARRYQGQEWLDRRFNELRFLEKMGEIKDVRPGFSFYFELGSKELLYKADFCYEIISTGETVLERLDNSAEYYDNRELLKEYYPNYVFIENQGRLRKPIRRSRY